MTEIKEQYDPYLRKKISQKRQVAIIPVGSLEQHGPHLPISTDTDIVLEIAKRISEKIDGLLMPPINYGISFEHSPFFNTSLKKDTLKKILLEICISLGKNRIKTIIILNGHHGNQQSLLDIPKNIRRISKGKVKVLVFSYWHFMKRDFDHAGFVETSIMLALSKKVKMKLAQKGLVTKGLSYKEKSNLSRLAKSSFITATKTGVWGDPRKATKKDGQKILSEIVQNLVKKVKVDLQT